MGNKTNTGFTIIEVMLFLAVTGGLAAALLVGSGAAISQQRYKDSLNSLKSYIQDQYSEVTNTRNSRTGEEGCSGAVVSGTAQARGTSDCLLLGRLVTIDATGTRMTASSVVGYRTGAGPVLTNDIAELATNYNLSATAIDRETTDVPWSMKIVQTGGSNDPQPFSLLIIKSPTSGATMTFSVLSETTQLAGMVAASNATVTRDLCVAGDVSSGPRMGVRIRANASSQGAIEIPVSQGNVCV